MYTDKDRMRALIEARCDDNTAEFSRMTGINKQSLYDIAKGRTGFSKAIMRAILKRWPDVSPYYLLGMSDEMTISAKTVEATPSATEVASLSSELESERKANAELRRSLARAQSVIDRLLSLLEVADKQS